MKCGILRQSAAAEPEVIYEAQLENLRLREKMSHSVFDKALTPYYSFRKVSLTDVCDDLMKLRISLTCFCCFCHGFVYIRLLNFHTVFYFINPKSKHAV